jgi:hypothetical protein
LKTLEQYLSITGFLRHPIHYYVQLAKPLQKYKVAVLARGKVNGRIKVGNKSKRAVYMRATFYKPTATILASFDTL